MSFTIPSRPGSEDEDDRPSYSSSGGGYSEYSLPGKILFVMFSSTFIFAFVWFVFYIFFAFGTMVFFKCFDNTHFPLSPSDFFIAAVLALVFTAAIFILFFVARLKTRNK